MNRPCRPGDVGGDLGGTPHRAGHRLAWLAPAAHAVRPVARAGREDVGRLARTGSRHSSMHPRPSASEPRPGMFLRSVRLPVGDRVPLVQGIVPGGGLGRDVGPDRRTRRGMASRARLPRSLAALVRDLPVHGRGGGDRDPDRSWDGVGRGWIEQAFLSAWCEMHRPTHVGDSWPAREVEAALLSRYAVDLLPEERLRAIIGPERRQPFATGVLSYAPLSSAGPQSPSRRPRARTSAPSVKTATRRRSAARTLLVFACWIGIGTVCAQIRDGAPNTATSAAYSPAPIARADLAAERRGRTEPEHGPIVEDVAAAGEGIKEVEHEGASRRSALLPHADSAPGAPAATALRGQGRLRDPARPVGRARTVHRGSRDRAGLRREVADRRHVRTRHRRGDTRRRRAESAGRTRRDPASLSPESCLMERKRMSFENRQLRERKHRKDEG